MADLRIGTSAFTAAGWPGTFYPERAFEEVTIPRCICRLAATDKIPVPSLEFELCSRVPAGLAVGIIHILRRINL